jgi:hypothetical protein
MKGLNNILGIAALGCFALCPIAQAVVPAPDGAYPNLNTAEGLGALLSLDVTTGSANTAVGWFSLRSDISGGFNTGVGAGALALNTGDRNTATGAAALFLNSTGDRNTADGTLALFHNTVGVDNTGVGDSALFNNTEGNGNTAVGEAVLIANTTGAQNTVVGAAAAVSNTIGNDNTAVGLNSLFSNTEGNNNTAIGRAAMGGNTTGPNNTAVGWFALASNVSAGANTAVGSDALLNFSGNIGFNTAVGANALIDATTGQFNTAIGEGALSGVTTGLTNIGIGIGAGDAITTGSGNVFIGVTGGDPGETSHTYIRNIKETPVNGGNADIVTIDITTGLLGRASSSRRYKEDIRSMDKSSEALYRLNPVTFRYKKEIDRTQSPVFGLIAEDVAEVNPDLVVHNAKGEPESIHYEMVNAMLLNEFLKEHKKVQALEATVAQQQKGFLEQEKRIEVLTMGLQKVSAQVELSKPARRLVTKGD